MKKKIEMVDLRRVEHLTTAVFIGLTILIGLIFVLFDQGRGPFITTPERGKQFLGAIGTLGILYLFVYIGIFWLETQD